MRSTDSARMVTKTAPRASAMDNRCWMCGCDTSKPKRPNRKPSRGSGEETPSPRRRRPRIDNRHLRRPPGAAGAEPVVPGVREATRRLSRGGGRSRRRRRRGRAVTAPPTCVTGAATSTSAARTTSAPGMTPTPRNKPHPASADRGGGQRIGIAAVVSLVAAQALVAAASPEETPLCMSGDDPGSSPKIFRQSVKLLGVLGGAARGRRRQRERVRRPARGGLVRGLERAGRRALGR